MNTIPLVPRIEDLPYVSSPPIEFTYRSHVHVSAGTYTWSDRPSVLTPNRPIIVNSLYYFRSVTLTADVEEMDFTSNIVTIPAFQMYLKSRAKNILFREPVYMVKFLQGLDYRFAWFTQQENDQLFAGFSGVLSQGAGLIGKNTIYLTAVVSAQEIVDERFVKLFRKSFPDTGGDNE
jgi:hypothetical protein